MAAIDFERLEDADLKSYHEFMEEAYIKAESRSRLSVAVWSLTLKELQKRGLIRLVGTNSDNGLDDPGDCAIQKLW